MFMPSQQTFKCDCHLLAISLIIVLCFIPFQSLIFILFSVRSLEFMDAYVRGWCDWGPLHTTHKCRHVRSPPWFCSAVARKWSGRGVITMGNAPRRSLARGPNASSIAVPRKEPGLHSEMLLWLPRFMTTLSLWFGFSEPHLSSP